MARTAPYYTAGEAAERLGVVRQRVYQLVHSGKLPHVTTAGGSYLIPVRAIDAYQPHPMGRPQKKSSRRGQKS